VLFRSEVDEIFSTSGMVNYVLNSEKEEFIIGTEKELIYRIKKELWKRGIKGKKLYGFPRAVCPNMKKITLKKLIKSLETLKPEIKLNEELLKKARRPLDRMVKAGRGR